MGCGASKVEDLKVVTLCRERKELIRAASEHRYALAAAHISYFRSLKEVGDALCRFVEDELVVGATPSTSSSSSGSPVLTLPSDEGKGGGRGKKNKGKGRGKQQQKKTKNKGLKGSSGNDYSSSSTSISHSLSDDKSGSRGHHHGEGDGSEDEDDDEIDDSHVHFSSEDNLDDGHIQIEDSPELDGGGGGGHRENNNNYNNNSNKKKKKKKEKKEKSLSSSSSPRPGISYVPSPPGMGYGNLYNNPYYTPYDPYMSYGYSTNTSYSAYYMKKSSNANPSVIYEEPKPSTIYYSDHSQTNPLYSNTGYFGFMTNSLPSEQGAGNRQQAQNGRHNPPTPPSPQVSAWDYFNPFDIFDNNNAYPGYYPPSVGREYESNSSSPDSREVREREGIPDLEEETESEVIKEVYVGRSGRQDAGEDFSRVNAGGRRKNVHFDGGRGVGFGNGKSSKGVPPLPHQQPPAQPFQPQAHPDQTFQPHPHPPFQPQVHPNQTFQPPLHPPFQPQVHPNQTFQPPLHPPFQPQATPQPVHATEAWEEPPVQVKEVTSSSSPSSEVASVHVTAEDLYVKRKGVSFEMDGASQHDLESSKLSSFTTLSANGIRDLNEVVREIKEEFVAATDYGQEVSQLLEAEKLPYRSRSALVKITFGRLMCSSRRSVSASDPSLSSRLARMTRPDTGDPENGLETNSLVSTLDKLYVWEKKLYKEVKDEEKLRISYEKQCRKLKSLDDQGAETSKIEFTQASIRKLLTKINVSIRAVDAIAKRIHQLRDEELQPQLQDLVNGLRRMWRLMLKCHHKQLQAIVESKVRTIRANTGPNRDLTMKATLELEKELLKWCARFNKWICSQKSYIDSLNDWLIKWLNYEPEETPDGPEPFSPGRMEAPLVFVICHDWKQAMDRISESGVLAAMNEFASSLHELRERQDEEMRRKSNAEFTLRHFEKEIRMLHMEKAKAQHGREDDASSGKGSLSMVQSDNGISALDDLKVMDLDSVKRKVKEERAGHKEAIKLVHAAALRSIQEGLVPIFEALESLTSEAVQAYENVRVEGLDDDL